MKKIITIGFCIIFVISIDISFAFKNTDEDVSIDGDRMEMLEKGRVTRFIGNVKLKQGSKSITSNKMTKYEDRDYIVAEGKVRIMDTSRDDERVEGFCDKINYDLGKEYGLMTGSPKLVRFDFEEPENNMEITGNVIKIFAEEKKILVEGEARVIQKEKDFSSDNMTLLMDEERIILEGNVKTVVYYEE